ncbi:hypothetical protein [Enhygromyxa salina]|uniref:Uncharacterized protein n=1 Tax=Enhygromyxa salina TaxID=215803 RepID=A0A2S9YTZ2_9BACT|nr:hypothetical protein [Enhygromyxa salina]PRQ08585.1 hypothetical protein ENSA7_16670 [Enhygromyxa salina]
MHPQTYPWMIPVPLRRSRYTALAPELASANVEVDLGAIGAFGVGARGPVDALGWADLQRCPNASSRGRLGSGRAVYVGGRYLKGVGRTPLAGNWVWLDDCYHHSGHMLVSAAVRELLVTRYLAGAGAEHTIVPCEGILVAPLDAALVDFGDVAFADDGGAAILVAADRRCQAISSKPGDFMRASNLVWLLDDIGCEDAMVRLRGFLRALDHGLGGSGDPTLTPTELVDRLEAGVARGAEHFRRFVELGVYWGSFANNFTLDGRFLDLEVCTVFERPTPGLLISRAGPTHAVRRCDLRQFVGFGVVHLLEQQRRFAEHLRRRLTELRRDARPASAALRGYLGQLVSLLDARLSDPGSWFGPARWRREVLGCLGACLPMSRAQSVELARLLDLRLAWGDDPLAPAGEFVRQPLAVPAPEPALEPTLYLPAVLAPLVEDDDRCAAFARANARAVEACEPATILARLRADQPETAWAGAPFVPARVVP